MYILKNIFKKYLINILKKNSYNYSILSEMSNEIETETDKLNNDDNNELNKLKMSDKNFHLIYRTAPFERRGIITYKKKQIGIYTSGDIGDRIRNAETGEYYTYTVGSKFEQLFFSVRLSTGECDGKYKLPTLFFTSPSHYESYLYGTVSDETREVWDYKRTVLMNDMDKKKTGGNVLVR